VSGDRVDLVGAAHALSGHSSSLARTEASRSDLELALDQLAEGIDSVDAWRTRVFVDAGFTGNGAEYHDVRNSFLPDVLDRRLGIPITLALVGRLVAERAGLVSWGVGLPGHFLLGVGAPGVARGAWWDDDARLVDPFAGGRSMSLDDVDDLFRSMFGPTHEFHRSMLDETSDRATLVRMLSNLKANYARMRSLPGLTAVIRMRTCLPDWSLDEGRELVRLLAGGGALDEAMHALNAVELAYPSADEVLADERARLARSFN
jgi:regulator of sirC expression with transglutaminase-like and TPR domain